MTLTCLYTDGNPEAEIVWRRGRSRISGETDSVLNEVLHKLYDGTEYRCELTNRAGTVFSPSVTPNISCKSLLEWMDRMKGVS